MKKNFIIGLTTLLLGTSSALATGSSHFEGVSVSGGLEIVSSKVHSTAVFGGGYSPYSVYYIAGDTSPNAVLDLSYSKAVNDTWLIGIGASYELFKTFIGNAIQTPIEGNTLSYYQTANYHFSIYLQPTYTLNDQTALFSKVGYHSINYMNDFSYYGSGPDFRSHNRVSGIGISFGMKHLFTPHIFIQPELTYVVYRTAYSEDFNYYEDHMPVGHADKIQTFTTAISIGYQF